MAEGTRHTWEVVFKEALDFDTWGQVEEAVSSYQRLQVAAAVEAAENKLRLQPPRQEAIAHLAAALQLRIKELNGSSAKSSLGLSGMQALKAFVAGLLVSDVQLPAAVAAALKGAAGASGTGGYDSSTNPIARQQPHHSREGSEDLTIIQQESSLDSLKSAQRTSSSPGARLQGSRAQGMSAAAPPAAAGTLRPALEHPQPGNVTLCVTFGSWSVKGAAALVEPKVLITVRDKAGKLLEAVQESPQVVAARSGDPDKLDLGFKWHLQSPLDCLDEHAAVFFELQHWKADKKKRSVKCYACLPYEEMIRGGAAMLEVYKKPADYKRRGRHPLLTTKPMYLHISRALTQH